MLRIHFTTKDLSGTTLASGFDPLWETLFSVHLLAERDDTLVFGEWRRRARAGAAERLRLLRELAPPRGYSADFLTPGRGGGAELDELVERLVCTPVRRLRHDLARLARQQPATVWTRQLGEGDPAALRLLGDAVASYYRTCLAPHHDRLREQVRADRNRRGEALLTGGVDRLLSGLHPRTRWCPPVLRVLDYAEDRDLYLNGRGLVLLPSVFCRHHPIALADETLDPLLAYPVSPGIGWLAPVEHADGRTRLTALLGAARAATLEASASACSTTQLAGRAGLSLSSASRHASVLRDAGLITTQRDGGTVVHQVTALGLALLNGSSHRSQGQRAE
ncbi:ArsR/SmtB family transcription factor [Amycolatopsis anabasis]|uniref:ArsR/SmtB family transcription factor n=1 Tax=Amycolatopsis anabasis TaxID=1840409 RepID=UPI00131A92ED|nr:winged helix-turn-helix domain-containing protein [Amycolatopsis anabasis]